MSPIMVIALMNVAITSIFAITAIKFDKWWIILFSILITVVPTKIHEEKRRCKKMRIQVNKDEFARLCFKCCNANCYQCILYEVCHKDAEEEDYRCTEKLARLCVITHEGEADS